MKLYRLGDVYIAESSYAAKDIAKSAGFVWNSIIERKWATKSLDTALKLAEYADGPLREEFDAILDQQNENRQASRAAEAEIDIPRPEGLEYLPFQKAGIAFALKNLGAKGGQSPSLGNNSSGVLIADEMG